MNFPGNDERFFLVKAQEEWNVGNGWKQAGMEYIAKSLSFHGIADYELYFHRLLLCEVDIAKYDEEWMEKLIG